MRFHSTRTQRVLALLPLMVLLLALGQSAVGPGLALTANAWAQETPRAPDVDVNIDSGGAWYLQPVWLGIGAAALILIIALLIAGSRNTTTVVK